jgi:hypothetical protein
MTTKFQPTNVDAQYNYSVNQLSANTITANGTNLLAYTNAAFAFANTINSYYKTFSRTYYYKGTITENVGTLRYYMLTSNTANIVSISTNLTTIGGVSCVFVVKKNGTVVNTITVPAQNTFVNQTGLNIGLVYNDYITIDVTKGSDAVDAYINIVYAG